MNHLLKFKRSPSDFNCDLSQPADLFLSIYITTDGHPCDECCCKPCSHLEDFKRGDVEIYKINTDLRYNPPVKTNSELGEKMGLSKRQISKMRKRGEL